jgi:hypothetical protein
MCNIAGKVHQRSQDDNYEAEDWVEYRDEEAENTTQAK